MRKISAHGINLPFDGVACHGSFGPAFGNHCAHPHVLLTKQRRRIDRFDGRTRCSSRIEHLAMQCKMRRFCNDAARQYGLELSAGFKPMHERPTSAQKQKLPNNRKKTSLDSQAFTAFGATGSNHCAAAARFHARQETVGACALDFGRLVCAFHDKSYWPYRACYWAVSCKASFGDSNEFDGRTTQPVRQAPRTANTFCNDLADEFAKKSTKQSCAGSLKPLRIGKTRDYHRFLTAGNKANAWTGAKGSVAITASAFSGGQKISSLMRNVPANQQISRRLI